MHKLIIVGAGGFGREVLAWARQSAQCGSEWEIKGFLDDNPDALNGKATKAPILGRLADYTPKAEDVFICAIGAPNLRKKVHQTIIDRGGQFTSIIHPTALLGENVTLGTGVILCPGAIVSVDTKIGDGVALNIQSMVGHDAVIGNFCQISPHCDILGYANLGDEVFMGSHAVVLPGVKIGARAVLGAGAVASREIPEGVTAVGLPAKPR